MNEAKKDLEGANAKLRELDQLKSMFIASMSHELRTPLNSIIGFSGIMLQGMTGEINAEQRDQLERVFRSGKHLLSLITDVIDIAKIESGKIQPFAEDFLLGDVIDEACESMNIQISDKGLELLKIIPETPIHMHTDRRRLLQCLLNFLSNAVKFSAKGKVCIEVAELQVSELARLRSGRGTEGGKGEGGGGISNTEHRILNDEVKKLPRFEIPCSIFCGSVEETTGKRGEEERGDVVEISVSDTGIGIKEKDMELLFGSFVRLDTPLKTTTPGTGLGLYLTKKLATEVLGGEVGAASEEGKGSRFWIRVPVFLEEREK